MPPEDNHQLRRTRSLGSLNRAALNTQAQNQGQEHNGRLSLQNQQNDRRLQSPLQIRPVTAELNAVQLSEPNDARIQHAYEAMGFEYADSDKKRRNLLSDS